MGVGAVLRHTEFIMVINSHEVPFVILVNVGLLHSNHKVLSQTISRKEKQTKPVATGIKYVGLDCKLHEYALPKENSTVEHPRCVCRITLLTKGFQSLEKRFLSGPNSSLEDRKRSNLRNIIF